MTRRCFAAGALSAGWFGRAWAQSGSQPALLVLTSDDAERTLQVGAAFKRACDFATRRSYQIASPDETGDYIVENLDGQPPALVFAVGALAARVGVREFPEIPVVYADVLEGEVSPGGNAIGLSLRLDPRAALGRLRALFPDMRRVAVLLRPDAGAFMEQTTAVAEALGFTLVVELAERQGDIPDAFGRVVGTAELLWLQDDAVLWLKGGANRLLTQAAARRFPVLGFHRSQLEAPMPPALVAYPGATALGEAGAQVARSLLLGTAMPALNVASAVFVGHTRALRAVGLTPIAELDEVVG